MRTLETDEIAGHVLTEAQVLAPMMWSGVIASTDAACTGEPRSASEGTWVLGAWRNTVYLLDVWLQWEEAEYWESYQKRIILSP